MKICTALLRFFRQIHFAILLKFYVALLLIFFLGKIAFVLYNGAAHGVSVADFCSLVWHGLPLDLATAGYLSIIPWLLLVLAIWVDVSCLRKVYIPYVALVALLLSVILLADVCLYAFWGFKLDGTVFNYLDNPKGVMASVTLGYLIALVAAFLLIAWGMFVLLHRLWPATAIVQRASAWWVALFVYVIAGGCLFLGIRGGVGKSTANVGMVYYSERTFLNHAAVNPAFSLMASMTKTKDFARMHNYFPEEKRRDVFESLAYSTESVSPDTLLTTQRPNVLIILMEGCGATFVEAFGGEAGVTPHLNRLAQEGVAFTQCYANSFRTDRGTLCALSGYPSFPDVSVMKLAGVAGRMPSIAGSLRRAGYHTEFVYGGDINFTNMNGYLVSTGYSRTYGDKDFSANERKTHDWGVTDRLMFNHLFEIIERFPAQTPWHATFLTLASHEPWIVPYHRLPHSPQANGMAYLDDCIGEFIGRFRQTPQWDNTLVILLPDHGIHYPTTMDAADMRRNHIPMIWTGGAVARAREVSKICNQTDLPATLLGQLGLPHDDFTFSRDVLSATYTHPCAIHTASGTLSYIDTTGTTVIDLVAQPERTLVDAPSPSLRRAEAAHAFLQTCYDDLGKRSSW